MKRFFRNALAFAAMLSAAVAANATGWPANFQGVMLQGFVWDSYSDTKWSNLESQADELSKYFKLIWVPQSAKPATNPSMGYDPVYWFTNYNSSFGNEKQLRSMINTYKEKGVGIIADVVVNHRSGATNWTDFPSETYNGKTYKLGPEAICCTDEVANQQGQAKPTGAPDTGEDFGSARDLDHTNATVRSHIKDYTAMLLNDFGYAGFRYDMVKGFSGQYVGEYNRSSKPTYSVGEYWDGSYDAVAGWIEATGKESAAFDFPFKYAVNKAFAENDMSQLAWKANGTTNQPAGMIHFGYAQYAVTFIDNHDTYREGYNKFNGNVLAANAFMLCSPGTPCVFLPHWKANKAAIKALIDARNNAGITNTSTVSVLRADRDCYMAEVTGTKSKLVVKIGSAQVTPQGYTNADIKASGNGYCVWSKAQGGGGGDDPIVTPGEGFKVYFDNSLTNWTTPYIHYWGGESESSWPGVAMTKEKGNVWVYTVAAGTTGCLFNAGDGDNSKTDDFEAVENHLYNKSGDMGKYNAGGDDPTPSEYPAHLYLVGTVNSTPWATSTGIAATPDKDGVYKWHKVTVDDAGAGLGYMTFLTALDEMDGDWNGANQADRYGAPAADTPAIAATPTAIKRYVYMVDAMAAESWAITPDIYDVTADLGQMMLTLVKSSDSVDAVIDAANDAPVEFYNLQGVRVYQPANGLYIRRQGNKVEKVYVR